METIAEAIARLSVPVVYLLYDRDGALVYIGKTKNPAQRLTTHSQQSSWWPEVATVRFIQKATEREALEEEGLLIAELLPRRNKKNLKNGEQCSRGHPMVEGSYKLYRGTRYCLECLRLHREANPHSGRNHRREHKRLAEAGLLG